MITFREYLIEYAKKENVLHRQLTGIKSGPNGKSFDRAHSRKNVNTVAKEYIHKHPLVGRVASGQADNVQVPTKELQSILAMYDVEFSEGEEKGLGNSGAKVKMFIDKNGNKAGIISGRKKQNGL